MTFTSPRPADDATVVIPVPPAGAEPEPPAGPHLKRAIVVGSVAALLLGAAGLGAYVLTGDVPRGTRVLGLDVGNKSRSEAERLLADEFGPRAAEPVAVDLDGTPVRLTPAAIGLVLDVEATVTKAMRGGVTLRGSRTVDPVVRLDQARLEKALRAELDPKKITLKKPGISYAGLTPKPKYPAPGRTIDPAQAAEAVRTSWLTGAAARVPLTEQPPATSRADVDDLIRTLAGPAVAAPVTVAVADRTFTLTPRAIAKALVFRADDTGKLTPAVDGRKLRAAARSGFAAVETEPEAASITLNGGRPKIVASTAGRLVDLDKLGPALLAVLPEPGPRRVTAELVRAEADTTAADMAKLGIKQKVSTFTTYFTGGRRSPRSQNIITIAKAVDGAVVRPGETFSLNGHTGERTYAKGYRDAPVILNGKLEPGVGGGASQFTTTLFNAAYYAGLQDVEHKPHSFYFSRYPAVIEATIFYPTLDLKFKNTTPYGILVDTSTTGRSVTVALWSTKVYDSVKTERSPRRNITSPPTVHREPGPKCIATGGLPGFTQDAWRIIRKDGKVVKREKFTWRYDPEPRFICGKKPS
ncbi:VanW family protein [Jidongwangia harbinensis]|uniref:VanW family protein n=1 Tax=Jidongwangia harbinensis TaxID=2878561 RepID=UPI001CD91C57|nr:VanW family protein [Jidongwangia harbinensis]MCA2214058.1 VanW family protein [Jidongwangia harbinensis]